MNYWETKIWQEYEECLSEELPQANLVAAALNWQIDNNPKFKADRDLISAFVWNRDENVGSQFWSDLYDIFSEEDENAYEDGRDEW